MRSVNWPGPQPRSRMRSPAFGSSSSTRLSPKCQTKACRASYSSASQRCFVTLCCFGSAIALILSSKGLNIFQKFVQVLLIGARVIAADNPTLVNQREFRTVVHLCDHIAQMEGCECQTVNRLWRSCQKDPLPCGPT